MDNSVDFDRQPAASFSSSSGSHASREHLRVLLRYLERVDPGALDLARQVLRDCDLKYRSEGSRFVDRQFSEAVNGRVRSAVGEAHWDEAGRILRQVICNQRARQRQQNGGATNDAASSKGGSSTPSTTIASKDTTSDAAPTTASYPSPIPSGEDGCQSQAGGAALGLRLRAPPKLHDQQARAEQHGCRRCSPGKAPSKETTEPSAREDFPRSDDILGMIIEFA